MADASLPLREAEEVVPVAPRRVEAAVPRVAEVEAAVQRAPQVVVVAERRAQRAEVAAAVRAWRAEGVACGPQLAADAFQSWVGALWLRAAAPRARSSSLGFAFAVAGSSKPQAATARCSAGWRPALASECSAFEYSVVRRA